jgi:SAM-dependent methyltransferase
MRAHELGKRFDAVSFLDAECYLPDKGLAIRRIAEILEPGARLLIVAWCRQGGLSSMQEELVLHPFMRYWGVPSLETQRVTGATSKRPACAWSKRRTSMKRPGATGISVTNARSKPSRTFRQRTWVICFGKVCNWERRVYG